MSDNYTERQNSDELYHEQGELWDRYQIYVACAEDLGWEVKTFDEWLNS